MVSAVCDGLTELLETVDEDVELVIGAEVSGARAVPEDGEEPVVADAIVPALLDAVDDEPVVDEPPVVPLVVVVPPAEVVVVEPVLPPLEDTEVVGEV